MDVVDSFLRAHRDVRSNRGPDAAVVANHALAAAPDGYAGGTYPALCANLQNRCADLWQESHAAGNPEVAEVREGLEPTPMGLKHADVLVSGPVVEKRSRVISDDHAFDENHVGHLADLLPVLFGSKERLVASRQQPARIIPVEPGRSCAIHQNVIRTVVVQKDASTPTPLNNRRRTWLGDARIEVSRPGRQH